jgi:hypothetical protein
MSIAVGRLAEFDWASSATFSSSGIDAQENNPQLQVRLAMRVHSQDGTDRVDTVELAPAQLDQLIESISAALRRGGAM